MSDYFAAARRWLAQDPDAETRAELQALLDARDESALAERFSTRLHFGTAGLRGPLRAGTNGMNRVLVAQTARGLADFLLARGRAARIVIGCDARRNSGIFARDSAAIFRGAGMEVLCLPPQLPTPVLAFALRYFTADAGVMVTASHNPPQDNGYKVYLGGCDGGAQIIPPADGEIAACIARAAETDIRTYPREDAGADTGEAVWEAYCRETAKQAREPAADLPYVYTALHGVGYRTFLHTLKLAGYPLPQAVDEQCAPDPAFPTVDYPNPEEEGALAMAIRRADACGAELILAHDPDADRLAVAIRERGEWRQLSGNTIGCWLGWEAAQRAAEEKRHGTLACSLVSSPLLAKIAARYGLAHCETLAGFKWTGRVPGLIFGYEEALGYLVDPEKIRDKDGISAAMAFLSLALKLRRQGRSFADYAAEFECLFGASASGQIALRRENAAAVQALLSVWRASPPQHIAGMAVENFYDYAAHTPTAEILRFILRAGDGEARVMLRPSGTEPKLKIYLDCTAATQKSAEALLARVRQGLCAHYAEENDK